MPQTEPAPRAPLSAAGNAFTSTSTAVQTLAIFAGLDGPAAAICALVWAAVAGAIGKVARDEMHALEQAGERVSVWRRLALTLGALLG